MITFDKRPSMSELKYHAFQSTNHIGEWRVEAFEYPEGLCYVAIFTGPNAEDRAEEYAAWKNYEYPTPEDGW